MSSSGTCVIGFLEREAKGAAVVVGSNEYAPHYLPHRGAAGLLRGTHVCARAMRAALARLMLIRFAS